MADDEKDLYQTLGLDKDAKPSPADIRKAARKRQKATHPDAPGGDKAEFQRVQTALAVLGDPDRRAHYDATGETQEKPKFERAAAIQCITTELNLLVSAFVTGGFEPKDDPTRIDVMARIRKKLREDIATGRGSVDIGQQHIAALRKTAARFKLKTDAGDGDPIADFFAEEVAKAEAQIANIEDSIRVHGIALKMLEGYRFEWDKPDPLFGDMDPRMRGGPWGGDRFLIDDGGRFKR